MTAFIVLDELSLPETGLVRLKLDRIFTINISATEARRRVSNWLAWEVTMTLMGQEPSLVISEPVVWRVPVVFTAAHVGVVGDVGEIDVNVESGEVIQPEGIEEAMPVTPPTALPPPPLSSRRCPCCHPPRRRSSGGAPSLRPRTHSAVPTSWPGTAWPRWAPPNGENSAS